MKGQRYFYRQILNIAFPLLFCIAVLYGLSSVFYNSYERNDIAHETELNLIGQFLKLSPKTLSYKYTEDYTIINIKSDKKNEPSYPTSEDFSDLAMEEYISLLKDVFAQKPKSVLIRLMTKAGKHSPQDLEDLRENIAQHKDQTKVIVTYPQGIDPDTPKILATVATTLDDDICRSYYCPYNKAWNDWVIQWLINHFSDQQVAWSEIISPELGSKFPVFITPVIKDQEILQYKMSEYTNLTDDEKSQSISDKHVFIGNTATTHNYDPMFSKGVRGYRTIFNITDPKTHGVRTPPHIHWAQIAHMSKARNFIKVVPQFYSNIFIAITIALLIYALFKSSMSSFVFAGAGLLIFWFFLSAFSFLFLKLYLLSFTYYYLISVLLIGGVFLKFANYLLSNWQLEVKNRNLKKSYHLKQNFISLISHNLNTPIAKLTTIMEVLPAHKDLNEAKTLINEMEYTIKTVLSRSEVLEKNYKLNSYIFSQLLEQINLAFNKFSRLHHINSELLAEDDENLPLRCDPKLAEITLIALAIMGKKSAKNQKMRILLSSTQKNIMSISCDPIFKQFTQIAAKNFDHQLDEDSYLVKTQQRFLKLLFEKKVINILADSNIITMDFNELSLQ